MKAGKEMVRARMIVKGRVQGVSFRAYTRVTADGFGLTGWVKNMEDGGVEVVAEGDKRAVEKLIKWCHTGPDMAAVKSVHVEWDEFKGEYSSFEIAY
jgi:acylphosphatase